jgi:MFS family permease
LNSGWFDRVFADLARSVRWSFLPPLMVYFAAGVSGLTSVVGTFFVKDYLDLSAAFLAGLTFWVGLPWVLKMPIGHLVDLFWRYKSLLVVAGAALIAASLGIMYALISEPAVMGAFLPIEAWFVISALLAPTGYVIQDVVADAMTVEAIPKADASGQPLSDQTSRAMHTTMQTLGRFAIIGGLAMVAAVNIFVFSGTESLPSDQRAELYAQIYLIAQAIPVISVTGVLLHMWMQRREPDLTDLSDPMSGEPAAEATTPNWEILGGGLAFAIFTIVIGLADLTYGQEIVFAGSLAVICYLISRLLRELPPESGRMLVGTAIIIFVFRAVPLPGPGQTWFEIDVLGFNEQFLAILSLITSGLTLAGLVLLRPLMASHSIAYIVVLLTVFGAALSLPNIGLYYGIQEWTAAHTGGIVDARFIAILDTAIESPLGQVAMVPMLAWIARNAPDHLKATFFAVMASFTNLALSASSLATKYLNQIYIITREVKDRETGLMSGAADYSELGILLIVVALVALAAPLVTVAIVQLSPLKTTD